MSSIAFVDTGGLYVSFAERLARGVDKLYYMNEYETAMGQIKAANYMIGRGIEGVEKVDSIYDVLDKVDVIMFPDCTRAAEQQDLISQGYKVFGSAKANILENDRFGTIKKLEEWGLPTPKYEIVKTVDELLELLEASKGDKYIKINRFRLDSETYRHWSYKSSEIYFNRLKLNIGGYEQDIRFLVQDPLEGCEVGWDGYCIDGKMPESALSGYELKDKAYVGRQINFTDLPKGMKANLDAVAEFMGEQGVNCWYSDEERVVNKKFLLTDPTCRLPCPVNEAQQVNWKNIDDIILKGAAGKLVEPEPRKEYVAQVLLSSNTVREDFLYVRFPEELSENVRLHHYFKVDNDYYVAPSNDKYNECVGAVVGIGSSVEEAIEQCLEIAKQVEGDGLHYDTHCFDDINETISEGAKDGITIFS